MNNTVVLRFIKLTLYCCTCRWWSGRHQRQYERQRRHRSGLEWKRFLCYWFKHLRKDLRASPTNTFQSGVLQNIADAFTKDPQLAFLGLDEYFKALIESALPSWRKLAAKSIELGLPMPCTVSALSFLDAYTCARLPANLIQAQRDYFGAHTYERLDKERGEFFHHKWINN